MSKDQESLVVVQAESKEQRRQRLSAGILIAVVGLLLMWGAFTRQGSSKIALSDAFAEVKLPTITLPGLPVVLGCAIIMVVVGGAFILRKLPGKVSGWLSALAGIALIVGFVVWSAAGQSLSFPLTNQFNGTFEFATPIALGAMCGVLCERAGVVNVAIEGQMIAAAFSASIVAAVTQNVWIALLAAVFAGLLSALLLAVFALRFMVDHVVLGVVINLLAGGLTGFVVKQLVKKSEGMSTVPVMAQMKIPVLGDIPFLGNVLFNQRPLTYLAVLSVILVWFLLYFTKWGLRVRSVGEHPHAADTVGIDVIRVKFSSVLLGGIFAGLGGAFFTIGNAGAFEEPTITAGNGFIALAAVIMGRWHPILAALMALFFGFSRQMEKTLGVLNTPLPNQLLLALPYILTIVAVAGLIGRVCPPAADGVHYEKTH